MNKIEAVLGATIILATVAATPVMANSEKWLVRTSGVYLGLDGDSNTLNLDVDNTWDVAVDGTLFLTPNVGVNVLATKLKVDVDSALGNLGSVDLVPPIVTIQYHFSPDEQVRPYVGAGFNYNIFSSESGTFNAINAEIDDEFGLIAQAGLDYMLSDNMSLNFDIKYLKVDDVGVKTDIGNDRLDLDAVIVGAGIGFRF